MIIIIRDAITFVVEMKEISNIYLDDREVILNNNVTPTVPFFYLNKLKEQQRQEHERFSFVFLILSLSIFFFVFTCFFFVFFSWFSLMPSSSSSLLVLTLLEWKFVVCAWWWWFTVVVVVVTAMVKMCINLLNHLDKGEKNHVTCFISHTNINLHRQGGRQQRKVSQATFILAKNKM